MKELLHHILCKYELGLGFSLNWRWDQAECMDSWLHHLHVPLLLQLLHFVAQLFVVAS